MKKSFIHILSAAAALLFVSCSVDKIDNPADNGLAEQEFTFEASLTESSTDPADLTKSSIGMEKDKVTQVLWTPGDAINIFIGQKKGKFVNNSKVASKKATFTGSFGKGTSYGKYWAIYPYNENNSLGYSSISFSIPAEQKSAENSFSDGQWPTMACSDGLNLDFYAICSGIQFRVKEKDVTSVTFINKDGKSINGTVKAAWGKNNKPEITEINGTDRIVVTPSEGTSFKTDKWYFVVFAPVTMTKGIEVYFQTDKKHCTYTNSEGLVFKRNEFRVMDKRDTKYEDTKTKSYKMVDGKDAPSSWEGTYLIVDKDSKMVFDESNTTTYSKEITKPALDAKHIRSNDFEACEVTISRISEKGNTYDVKTKSGKYVYLDHSTILHKSSTHDTNRFYCTFNYQKEGKVSMISTNDGKGAAKYYFSYKNSTFSFFSEEKDSWVLLYKLEEKK